MKLAKITLVVLIVLTILSAIISNSGIAYASQIILLFAGLKFIGISYYFMELIKAHIFWRAAIGVFVFIILAVVFTIY